MISALQGKRIVNTRAAHQAASLDSLLRAQGAIPLAYPCIAIMPPDDSAPLDQALYKLVDGKFDWLVITSANTVLAIKQRLDELGLQLTDGKFRTAAIGSVTAEAIQQQLGLMNIELPPQQIAESLAEYLPLQAGSRIFLPESSIARSTLADHLTRRGASVSVVDAYQTVCGIGGEDISQLLAKREIDAITFTSSSTASYFLERVRQADVQADAVVDLPVACIGSKTADTAVTLGFRTVTTASDHTLDGLITALDAYFSQFITTGNHL